MALPSRAQAVDENAARDFHFTQQDFLRVKRMIYQHAGINLNDSKEQMVYSRLARRLRALGLDRFDEYLGLLADAQHPEWEHFINALTTNLTAFFREMHHFDILRDYLRHAAAQRRQITIWCSASSTGEEPYSIAMTAVEAFGSLQPPVAIIASDLDTNVLDKAANGVYTEDKIARLPERQIKQFFLRGKGDKSGLVRVRRELRDLITFRQINLLHDDWPVRGPLDIIFCRNVMIYFDKETQRQILAKFAPLLRSDGRLFVGHSENLHHSADLFRSCQKTVYRLAEKGTATDG